MTGNLPNWLERMFDLDTGPGEGLLWNLEHAWPWPPWATLLLVLFAVTFVVTLYLRERVAARRGRRLWLAALRLGVIALVLVMLSQLALSLQRSGLPYVVVLLDDSQSMEIIDPASPEVREAIDAQLRRVGLARPSRWNLARFLLLRNRGEWLRTLGERYRLRLYYLTGPRAASASDTAGLVDELRAAQPSGTTSPLGAAVRAVLGELRGTPPAAIILLTDGINTEGPPLTEAAALARRRGVPLFTVGLGDEKPPRDLRITGLLVDDVVFVNDIMNLEFTLIGTGFEGKRVEVRLRQAGRRDVLASLETVVAAEGEPQQLRLTHRPAHVGQFDYIVEVLPVAGELQTANNSQQQAVEVRKEKIRVLLVQAYPNYEFRYLRNLLGRDETIEIDTVLQEADVAHAEQEETALPVVPVNREDLFAYDVIILGDVNPALLSATVQQQLFDFVAQPGKGGAIVFIAGPRFMPLAFRDTPLTGLMPIDLESARAPEPGTALADGFRVEPTELGLTAHPPLQLGDTPAETEAIWRVLPPLYWQMEAGRLKPGARVLAVNPERQGSDGEPFPLIVLQYVGAGRTLMHLTDETWRWRWRVGDVFFARYWVQTLRYLARSKLNNRENSATLTTDREEYRPGEPVRFRLRFADQRRAPPEDDGVTVVVEGEGRPSQRLRLQRTPTSRAVFEAALSGAAVGQYHAWVASPPFDGAAPAADFRITAPPGEAERTQMDAVELRRAADQTKGRFYHFASAQRLLADLPAGQQVPIESLPPMPLWNRWPVLACLLALLVTEWILRKRAGMM